LQRWGYFQETKQAFEQPYHNLRHTAKYHGSAAANPYWWLRPLPLFAIVKLEMKQAAESPTTKSRGNDADMSVGILALTFLDTTWRIATPVILFTVLGIVADRTLGSKPWITLLCVAIGFAFAVLLVKKQLEAVQKAEGKK
jgi:F0F1-type ATP synthase assembly protein I